MAILVYAKSDSIKLIRELYRNAGENHLNRKKLKISKILDRIGRSDIMH